MHDPSTQPPFKRGKTWGFAVFIAMIGALLSGCYTLTIEMSVNEDSSGEAVMSIELHEEFLDAMVLADPDGEILSRADACKQMTPEAGPDGVAPEPEDDRSLPSGFFGTGSADADIYETVQTESVVVNDGEQCIITERITWHAIDFADLASDPEFLVARTEDGHWAFTFPPDYGDTAAPDDIALSDADMAMLATLGVALPDISIVAALPGGPVEHNADLVVSSDGATTFTWSRNIAEIGTDVKFVAVTHPDAPPAEMPDEQASEPDDNTTLPTAPDTGTTTTVAEPAGPQAAVEETLPDDDEVSTVKAMFFVLLFIAVLVALWLWIRSRRVEGQNRSTVD